MRIIWGGGGRLLSTKHPKEILMQLILLMQHVTLRVILMNLVYENTACNNEVVKKPFS